MWSKRFYIHLILVLSVQLLTKDAYKNTSIFIKAVKSEGFKKNLKDRLISVTMV